MAKFRKTVKRLAASEGMSDFTKETLALIDYLQSRELDEDEACAVMGHAIASILRDRHGQSTFLSALANAFDSSAMTTNT